jgi:hypothetical protein
MNVGTAIALLGRDNGDVAILCECGREDCITKVTLSSTVYRNIRRQGAWFVIVDGHERIETDKVVQRNDAFTLVEVN